VKVVQFFSKETLATNSLRSLENTCTVRNIALNAEENITLPGYF